MCNSIQTATTSKNVRMFESAEEKETRTKVSPEQLEFRAPDIQRQMMTGSSVSLGVGHGGAGSRCTPSTGCIDGGGPTAGEYAVASQSQALSFDAEIAGRGGAGRQGKPARVIIDCRTQREDAPKKRRLTFSSALRRLRTQNAAHPVLYTTYFTAVPLLLAY